jgi:hypothetical protein
MKNEESTLTNSLFFIRHSSFVIPNSFGLSRQEEITSDQDGGN